MDLPNAKDEMLRLQIKEEQMSKTLVEERLDRHLNEACLTRVVTKGELGQRIEDMGKELSKTRERLANTNRAAAELKKILESAQKSEDNLQQELRDAVNAKKFLLERRSKQMESILKLRSDNSNEYVVKIQEKDARVQDREERIEDLVL